MTKVKRLPMLVGALIAVGVGALVLTYVDRETDRGVAGEPPTNASAPSTNASVSRAPAGVVPLDLYLRRWQGMAPDVTIRVGPARPLPIAGVEAVPVTLARGGREQRVEVLRSVDGRYLIAGPMLDLSEDPHAAVAERLDLEDRATLGPAGAPLTVVEYSSFQCPYCRRLAPVVKATLQGPLGKDVRWVYKHFPLSTQAWSEPAAVGAECARRIGGNDKFWALHDFYFDQQPSLTPQNHRERAVAWAREADLPVGRFERCLDSPDALARVREDAEEGRLIGVSSTPTLVINGRLAPGTPSRETLEAILTNELAYRQALARAREGK